MAVKTEVHRMDGDDPLDKAILYLAAHCYGQGVREAGDKVTILIPDGIEVGFSKDGPPVELGEWEITLVKVS